MTVWTALADRVWVRRYEELDLSVGLIVGDDACLVIDTRGDTAQGAELAAAAREITPHPWSIVYTHGHFDHAFGTAAFGDADIWAHRNCPARLPEYAATQREQLEPAEIVLPNRLVDSAAELSIGGRTVRLVHPGPAHTDHDLMAHVPDADIIFAGDLVENGAPPQFGDAHPLRWPDALDQIMKFDAGIVVPGHGDPVDQGFVAEQRDELLTIAELCREVWSGGLPEDDAITRSPYPADFTRAALGRAA